MIFLRLKTIEAGCFRNRHFGAPDVLLWSILLDARISCWRRMYGGVRLARPLALHDLLFVAKLQPS